MAKPLKDEFPDIYSSREELGCGAVWGTVRAGDLENQEPLCIYKFRIVQLIIMETCPCHVGRN